MPPGFWYPEAPELIRRPVETEFCIQEELFPSFLRWQNWRSHPESTRDLLRHVQGDAALQALMKAGTRTRSSEGHFCSGELAKKYGPAWNTRNLRPKLNSSKG